MNTKIDNGTAAKAFYLRNYRVHFKFEQVDSANRRIAFSVDECRSVAGFSIEAYPP